MKFIWKLKNNFLQDILKLRNWSSTKLKKVSTLIKKAKLRELSGWKIMNGVNKFIYFYEQARTILVSAIFLKENRTFITRIFLEPAKKTHFSNSIRFKGLSETRIIR